MANEQQTSPEQREALRRHAATLAAGDPWWPEYSNIQDVVMNVFPALLADADALAAALGEVERLQERLDYREEVGWPESYAVGLADAAYLMAENKRLREALNAIADIGVHPIFQPQKTITRIFDIARAALAPADGSGKEARG